MHLSKNWDDINVSWVRYVWESFVVHNKMLFTCSRISACLVHPPHTHTRTLIHIYILSIFILNKSFLRAFQRTISNLSNNSLETNMADIRCSTDGEASTATSYPNGIYGCILLLLPYTLTARCIHFRSNERSTSTLEALSNSGALLAPGGVIIG